MLLLIDTYALICLESRLDHLVAGVAFSQPKLELSRAFVLWNLNPCRGTGDVTKSEFIFERNRSASLEAGVVDEDVVPAYNRAVIATDHEGVHQVTRVLLLASISYLPALVLAHHKLEQSVLFNRVASTEHGDEGILFGARVVFSNDGPLVMLFLLNFDWIFRGRDF